MTDLTLFVDPHETGFPSTVRELLNDTEKRKANICATVTPLGKCLLICNNHIYVWSSISSVESGIPHGTHMELPPTGLKYTTQLICLFNKGHNCKNLSLLAVSPEGYLRYWAELGKQPRNEECMLNNEVAHSIQQIDSQEHVHRFLLTTTTGSFHIIDLFHGSSQPDRLATRPIDVGGPGGGIGRRMSLLLFGSLTAEKEPILKTLFMHGYMGKAAGVVNVLSRYLRFYALIDQKAQNHEVDVADLALNKYNKNREKPEHRHFRIVDAAHYRNGILLMLVGEKESSNQNERRFLIDRKLFIAYYQEINTTEAASQPLRSLIHIELPERLTAIGLEKRLQTATLLCPETEECCIAFYDSFLLIRHPTNPSDASTMFMDSYATQRPLNSPLRDYEEDTLLGAAAVHGTCQLVLKEAGICTIRRLPRHYDLHFWKRYRTILNQLDDAQEGYTLAGTERRLKDAFVDFCAKDTKKAKISLRQLLEQMKNSMEGELAENGEEEGREGSEQRSRHQTKAAEQQMNKSDANLAEMATDLLLYFVDRQPTVQEDPRWTFSADTPITHDQKIKLRQLAETQKFELIQRQLKIKIAFCKMFVLFLRTFYLVEWIDYPLQAFQMRSGKAVVAELGEKLVAMTSTFHWLSEHSQSLPLVNRALSELAKQYITRYGLPKANPYLSPTDYVFNKVSTFNELVSAVVQAGEQAMQEEEAISSNQAKANAINEVGSLLLTLIEGVYDARREEWAMQLKDEEYCTWLNQPDFLTHFTTHLNTALDYLTAIQIPTASANDAATHSNAKADVIFVQCVRLADFVLSQQSVNQRNDSKIIARFSALSHQDIALELAEKYKDFTFLVVYCHNRLDERRRAKAISRYKEEYGNDFYAFLYTWYQQKGMFNHLLAEHGQRANDFLAERQEINWIRQIEEGKYAQARTTLERMARDERDGEKKLIELSLCKLAALCEEQENMAEIAQLSEQIRALHERNQTQENDRIE